MRNAKPKRGGRPTKRLDLTDLRHLLRDHRQWTALGVVIKPDDGGEHWEIVGANEDIMVEVALQPTQEVVSARLAAGMWVVPNVGDEVAVILPAGELDFMPVITCVLGSSVPSSQGPQPNRIVIVRGEVLVHDGAGGAEPLVKRSEFHKHTHLTAGTGVPVPPSSIVPTTPQQTALDTSFPGTTVFKAK